MRILIFGSRHWKDYNKILDIMKRLYNKYGNFILIEGGCKGVDSLAKQAAIEIGLQYKEYPADWNEYGLKAGPIRNQQMIDEGKPDMAIGFHENIMNSKGSRDMLKRLINAGIPRFIIK